MDRLDLVDQTLPQVDVAAGILHHLDVLRRAIAGDGPADPDLAGDGGVALEHLVVTAAQRRLAQADVLGDVVLLAGAAQLAKALGDRALDHLGLGLRCGRCQPLAATAQARAAAAAAGAAQTHAGNHFALVAVVCGVQLGSTAAESTCNGTLLDLFAGIAHRVAGRRSRGRHGTVFSNFFRLVTVAALGTPGLFFKAPRGGLAHLQRRLGSRPRADIRRNFKGLAGLQHRRTLGRHRQDIAERRPVDAVALVVVLGL